MSLRSMSHIRTLKKDEITVHESSPSRDSSKGNIDELKDHLGLKYIVSSVEEMKGLFHEVVGKRKLEASEPNTSKKARTEEASVPRADNSSSDYDPTDIVELSTLHQGHEEPFFRRFSTIQSSVDPESQRSLPLESTKPVKKRLSSRR